MPQMRVNVPQYLYISRGPPPPPLMEICFIRSASLINSYLRVKKLVFYLHQAMLACKGTWRKIEKSDIHLMERISQNGQNYKAAF